MSQTEKDKVVERTEENTDYHAKRFGRRYLPSRTAVQTFQLQFKNRSAYGKNTPVYSGTCQSWTRNLLPGQLTESG